MWAVVVEGNWLVMAVKTPSAAARASNGWSPWRLAISRPKASK